MTQITVQQGDTLWKIAQTLLGNGSQASDLARLNNIKNPRHLQPGTTINVPDPVPLPRLRPEVAQDGEAMGAPALPPSNVARGAPVPAPPQQTGPDFSEADQTVMPRNMADVNLLRDTAVNAMHRGNDLTYDPNVQPQTAAEAQVLDQRLAADPRLPAPAAPVQRPDFTAETAPVNPADGQDALRTAMLRKIAAQLAPPAAAGPDFSEADPYTPPGTVAASPMGQPIPSSGMLSPLSQNVTHDIPPYQVAGPAVSNGMPAWQSAPLVAPPGDGKWQSAPAVARARRTSPMIAAAPAAPTINFDEQANPMRAYPPQPVGVGMPEAPSLKGDLQPMAPGIERPAGTDTPESYRNTEIPAYSGVESAILGAGDIATSGTLDELAAGLKSALGGGSYDDALNQTRAQVEGARSEHPNWFIGGQLAGSIPTMVMPGLGAARGGSLGLRVLKGLGTGGALGAAYGYGSGEGGAVNRTMNAGESALIGAGFGGMVPAAGSAIGKVARAYLASNAGSKAAMLASRAVGDDALTPATLSARMNDLGPEAMIADAGPNTQRQAAALASVPGRAQQIVRDAMLNRNAGANMRIRGGVDTAIGPAPVPSAVDKSLVLNQRALGPEYRAALQGAHAVDTTPIANDLDSQIVNLRGPAQQALQKVRTMLNITGQNVLDPNPGTLFETRQAIDGMLDGETNTKVIGALGAVRRQIDDELAANVPGIKDVDAKFAELARQREALNRGQQVLDSGRTAPRPSELADEVANGAIPQGTMTGPSAVPMRLRQGARAEIERIVGTNNNDVVALNKLIKGEGSWNRDRLATLFGADKADQVLKVLDREKVFAETANTVLRNSETAARLAAQGEVAPTQSQAGIVRSALNLKAGDAAVAAADKLVGGTRTARQAAINQELARILMTRGGSPQASASVLRVARALQQGRTADRLEQGANTLLLPFGRVAAPTLLHLQHR